MDASDPEREIVCSGGKDSQDTYCEMTSPLKSQFDGTENNCSEPLFSEDYDMETAKIPSESDEVQIISNPPSIITLPSDTDSTNGKSSINSLTDKIDELTAKESNGVTHEPSPIPEKCKLLKIDCNLTPEIFKCELTPVKMPFRNSPRLNSKRQNSLSCDSQATLPVKRLNVSVSTSDSDNNPSDRLENKTITDNKNRVEQICTTEKEEKILDNISLNESNPQNATNDSQNIVLEYCPSQSTECVQVSLDKSDQDPEKNKFTNISTDDNNSTVSINLDSPLNNNIDTNIALKAKPYLSNGYSSSTPEMTVFSQQFKAKMSNDSDGTPPFREYNKPVMLSKISKSDSIGTTSNTSISPISNGQSDGSYTPNISNQSLMPIFDVQIHCDDKNDFLSLLIVKTDNELGLNISKEYQKITKNINTDHYYGDISKSNSPSSVTSGGLLQLQPRTSFMSSSSSSSSIRTHDGTFAIPQKPSRNCVTIKGLHTLKQKVDDVINHLIAVYSPDDSLKMSTNNSYECDKKTVTNGNSHEVIPVPPVTPKSSKKKLQTKKRTFTKSRKILPTTSEEINIDGEIHSPEMVGTDPDKCKRPCTPLRNPKFNEIDNNNLMKSPTKSAKKSDSMQAPKPEFAQYCPGTLVLAKWSDKKYYYGKVKEAVDVSNYIIEFFDDNEKKISEDFIIFGNTRELPILGQSIHAIVDKFETYEPSLVLELVEEDDGTVLYKCTTDRDLTVTVNASKIYVTEDQAKSIRECCLPQYGPSTPRSRKANTEVDLDNIIHGPRSCRLKNRKDLSSPASPKASTSGMSQKRRTRKANQPKQRHESESSEGGEASRTPSSLAIEEVIGVQPEIQKTPKKIDGVKVAGPMLIKGVSKQNVGSSSKITKFESDSQTNNLMGPIPPQGSDLFKDFHFIITFTDPPRSVTHNHSDTNYSETESSNTEKEDYSFSTTPFNRERLREQLETGGGIVYGCFEQIPKDKYSVCKLIAPRPCFTAKYIQCLAADIKALSHCWVVRSCLANKLVDMEEDVLPAGWSIERQRFINWKTSSFDRNTTQPFKDRLILFCSDDNDFLKFWRRVCTMAGSETRTIKEDCEMTDGLAIVTDLDCPHEVQNKATYCNIPLVSTHWIIQCLIDGKICKFNASEKYNFAYSE